LEKEFGMAIKRAEWPEAGDLVLASVQRITDFGAYVALDDYGKEGLLHVSEVSSGWVRNIRDFVREGQKVVLKVLRVNTEKGHIDLSLRRVSRRERREKLLSWKMERKANSLMRSVSEKLKITLEEMQAKTGPLMEEKFGGIYEGLEKAAREGSEPLIEAGVPKELATTIAEVAKEKIKLPMVKVKGTMQLQCIKPTGALVIRDALLRAGKIGKPEAVKIHLYVVAAPKYAIEVQAEDYKEAEKILQQAAETAIETVTKAGGTGAFQRTK
jgi:translation initiation factor 2 subunit 1